MTIDLELAIRLLRLLTPMAASLALATVSVGLVTAHWLYSEEKMPNPKFNRTGDPELEYLSKFTVSGLWNLCYINPGETEKQCFDTDFFPDEEYSPDPNDSTLSIPYAVLRSCPFFFLAACLLVFAEVACFLGHFVPRRRYCTFISGVTFILSGLLLLLGLVVYVSVFTAEIGSKLRPTSTLQPALFTYTYGYSFKLVVTGFLAAEVAGTWAIFLFIYWHRNRIQKKEMHRKMALALVQTPALLSAVNQQNLVSGLADHSSLVALQQQMTPDSAHQQQSAYNINGFLLPCSCAVGTVSASAMTDDECCSIPTPPPAIYSNLNHSSRGSHLHHHHHHHHHHSSSGNVDGAEDSCPVHFVTVHARSLASNSVQHLPTSKESIAIRDKVVVRRPPSIRRQAPVRDATMMPDITALGDEDLIVRTTMTLPHRRQISTESEKSGGGYHQISSAVGSSRQQHHQQMVEHKICYQCHGAGHVTVPAFRNGPFNSSSLPRDLTSSTIMTLDLEDGGLSADDSHPPNESTGGRHGRGMSANRPQHHESLRRITAV